MNAQSSLLAIASLLAVAGCADPTAYLRLEDGLRAAAGLRACVDHARTAEWARDPSKPEVIFFHKPDECYRFDRVKVWSGDWVLEEETSDFRPTGRSSAAYGEIWLDVEQAGAEPLRSMVINTAAYGRYGIRFEGRMVSRPGAHGHFGAYRRIILVDRVIRVERQIEP